MFCESRPQAAPVIVTSDSMCLTDCVGAWSMLEWCAPIEACQARCTAADGAPEGTWRGRASLTKGANDYGPYPYQLASCVRDGQHRPSLCIGRPPCSVYAWVSERVPEQLSDVYAVVVVRRRHCLGMHKKPA